MSERRGRGGLRNIEIIGRIPRDVEETTTRVSSALSIFNSFAKRSMTSLSTCPMLRSSHQLRARLDTTIGFVDTIVVSSRRCVVVRQMLDVSFGSTSVLVARFGHIGFASLTGLTGVNPIVNEPTTHNPTNAAQYYNN